jgi:hypothetical protein
VGQGTDERPVSLSGGTGVDAAVEEHVGIVVGARDRSLMAGGRVKGHGPRLFFLLCNHSSSIPTMPSPSFRAQERSRTALLQRRRRRVLDGSEHGRTMMDGGEPNGGQVGRWQNESVRFPAELGEAAHDLSSHGTQTDAATIETRRAETRTAGLGRAGPSARAIERGPTEGREPPKSFVSGLSNLYA